MCPPLIGEVYLKMKVVIMPVRSDATFVSVGELLLLQRGQAILSLRVAHGTCGT